MKLAATLALSFIVLSAVFISGCIQQDTTTPSGGEELTQEQTEEQAFQAIESEMEQAIDEMTLEEIENELLTQG